MARTALAVVAAPGTWSNAGAALALAAGDAVNGNEVVHSGPLLIVAFNSGAAPYNVTVHSVPDRYGRSGDIVQAVNAGAYAVLGPFLPPGWMQPDGKLNIDVSNAAIELAAVKLPG